METLIISIPEGIKPPKFELFQSVVFENRQGVIVGASYTSALDALHLCNYRRWGWAYDISYVFGKTPEAACSAPEQDFGVRESAICPLNPVEAKANGTV